MNFTTPERTTNVFGYDPFGTALEGRNWSDGSEYRYGFNGQEQEDEVYGNGNLNTAEFWEYDTRLGRRWNLDPKPNFSVSLYACFLNNPILFSDPKGDTTTVYSLRGRLIRVIPDKLENQVHYINVVSEMTIWLKNWPSVLKGEKGALNNWSTEIRSNSLAYIGSKTLESANKINTEGEERGGIVIIGDDRQLLLVDKTDALKEKGFMSSDDSFPMSQINSVVTEDERPKVFGTWHTHPNNYAIPTNYRDKSWLAVGNTPYMNPDDYYGYLNVKDQKGTYGGHMSLLITKDYMVTYETALLGNYLGFFVKDKDSEKVFGVYKKFKKSSF